jgi:hypothetical protein
VKGTTRQLLTVIGGLIAGFLILEHATGFSNEVAAISKGGVGVIKTLQGR